MEKDYPKFQVSIVFSDYNFTVRCENHEELFNALESIKPLVDKARESTPKAETKTCGQCGGTMEHKSGTSKKTGKPWSGWFCANNKEHAEWDK